MKKKIIALLICIVAGIVALAIVIYNKESEECKTVAVQIQSIIVDYNSLPVSNVKIYEGLVANEERAISNSQGEFNFYSGVCGEFTLQFVTPDGKKYTKKYDREHVPKLVKLENEN
ncbi:hypothetical protein V7183_04100 [Bacillus sp. JJ1127]|uniref:hypothetical protein n=1 Tax=Bacillus sp. JJ1127 TaxID=3122952 RepID=UPI002FFDDBAF